MKKQIKARELNKKRIVAIIIVILSIFIVIWQFLGVFLSIFNYKTNSSMWDEGTGVIYNQRASNVKDLKYGFGTVGGNGCGAVAIYNIMYLEGKKVQLPQIIKSMDNGQFFFGLLGTKPSHMMKYLRKQGFCVQLHEDKSKFDEFARQSKYSIYIYVGKTSGHYALLVPNKESNTYQSINPNQTITMSEMIEKHRDKFINLLMTVE